MSVLGGTDYGILFASNCLKSRSGYVGMVDSIQDENHRTGHYYRQGCMANTYLTLTYFNLYMKV